jgi:membrane-bound lytic murein transglycosylase F
MLDRIRHSGKLLVGMKHDSSHYNRPIVPDEFELELLHRFAASLQLSLQLEFYPSDEQLIKALLSGDVYMAAGSLIINEQKQQRLQFSIPYHEAGQILLYRMGNPKPEELADMQTGTLEIAPGSHQELLLKQLRQDTLPGLTWITSEQDKSQLVLPRLNAGKIEFTITSKHEYEQNRAYYPYVLPGMSLSDKEPIAWGTSRTPDDSLLQAANQFLAQQAETGELQELGKKHFQTIEPRSFVDQREFWKSVKQRLPKYEHMFKQAATETGIDWLLLAAVGYQESHWDPQAVSPTEVKGIMMLTKAASEQLKLSDRADPKQSILGGARYLVWKTAKIPERIQGQDRLWFALAAYNVGYGHLEDARILTQRQGGNPDLWEEVKRRLPLLSKKKYYETLKHGKARGQEPVTYVANVRYFHRLLSWYYYQSPEKPEG